MCKDTCVQLCQLASDSWRRASVQFFNHAFVYVIKTKREKTNEITAPRTALYCPQLRTDQMLQCDVGPVFIVAHAVSKCSRFNDMQVIPIMWKLQKAFQMLSTRMTALPVNIFMLSLYFGPCTRGSNDPLQRPKFWYCNYHVVHFLSAFYLDVEIKLDLKHELQVCRARLVFTALL